MKILFLSNGFGEDAIGAMLCQEIFELLPETTIKVLPLVGEGQAYLKLK